MIALKVTGFAMIVCACYIAGTIVEKAKQKSIIEISDIINTLEQMLNTIRCDKTTVLETLRDITSHKSVLGVIAQKALCEYEAKQNVQLNEILLDNLSVYKSESYIFPDICNALEYLFERLGKNDLEYQICIMSETLEKLKAEYNKRSAEYTKTKGLYVKASLCIGVIVAVFFV